MVKGSGKSSASSGTRKKHARKAAAASGTDGQAPPPPVKPKKEKGEKGGKKGSSLKKEPRQKVYIPPVKPAPPQPDPLETTGLAHRLPPELLVVLRTLGVKLLAYHMGMCGPWDFGPSPLTKFTPSRTVPFPPLTGGPSPSYGHLLPVTSRKHVALDPMGFRRVHLHHPLLLLLTYNNPKLVPLPLPSCRICGGTLGFP
ncbi:hypothetical protein K435DRAFT_848478 [Dendrothele bispora CBS 962.96]|uniref:Uncharacterized protein n=1 Tax=Dendrothele bispora (strain CBS 962.96) TaxID=1314807 RepID=A0A4S8MXC3_DENBC|nr:hypothetical protein K435DRAFT_848478 [Dendrothele bispora CBS 962.96]